MNKVILTLRDTRLEYKGIPIISLLKEGESEKVSTIRKNLLELDLQDSLILSTSSKINKLFKDDYEFNDHGIYYPILPNPDKTGNACGKVVFFEKETASRDLERFLLFEDFLDPILGYSKSDVIEESSEYILDIETTGLDFKKDKIFSIGIKALDSKLYHIISAPTMEDIKVLFKTLEHKLVIGHNLVFDLTWLLFHGGFRYFPENIRLVDTMLLAHVSGERKLSLKHLSMMYGDFLGRRGDYFNDEYLLEDLLSTECLFHQFSPYKEYTATKIICEATKSLCEMRLNGVYFSQEKLFELRDTLKPDEFQYNFNYNSPLEVQEFFLSQGVHLKEKTATGNFSVAAPVLKKLDNEVVKDFLKFKSDLNIYQKFIVPYCNMTHTQIHADFLLWGTETGRLSCRNPNLQQIPNASEFKDIFRSRFKNGYIGSLDLDQAELRVAALLSQDEIYAQALLADDFHSLIASKAFNVPILEVTKSQRNVAKTVNFGGVLYGGSAKGIAFRIGESPEVVQQIQIWYESNFPILTSWMEEEKEKALQLGYVVTYFGRRRWLSNKVYRKDEIERLAVNTLVQSVASDIMTFIVAQVDYQLRKSKLKSVILFPVHDEILLDIHPDELTEVQEILQQSFSKIYQTSLRHLRVSKILPMTGTFEYGSSWLYVKNKTYPSLGFRKFSSF